MNLGIALAALAYEIRQRAHPIVIPAVIATAAVLMIAYRRR